MPMTKTGSGRDPRTYRSGAAPWLTGLIALLGVVVAAAGWGQSVLHHLAALCAGLAVITAGWALYWRPRLEVHPELTRVVNPLRTTDVPWTRLVDVRTRWSVTLVTDRASHSCFALPAAGAGAALRAGRDAVDRAHPIARPGGSVRVGDLTSTASGAAAHDVRTVWQQKIATGELDVFASGPAEQQHVTVHYVPAPLATAAFLAVASAALYLL